MNTKYPPRPLEGKAFTKCVCGHASCWHKSTYKDAWKNLFKDDKSMIWSGACDSCMCPKFQAEGAKE